MEKPHTVLNINGGRLLKFLKVNKSKAFALCYEKGQKSPWVVMHPLEEPEGVKTVHIIMTIDEAN